MRKAQFMYDLHVEEITLKKLHLRKAISIAQSSLDYCTDKLDKYRNVKSNYSVTIDDILNRPNSDGLAFVSFKGIKEATYETNGVGDKEIKHYLRLYILTHRKLIQYTNQLNKLKLAIPPDSIFVAAIYNFNYNMIKEVLMGARFRLGHKVGSITVIEKERTTYLEGTTITKNINWNESFLNKQRLIAEGKTPYAKVTAPHGVKWFVYHDEPYTYWYKWTSSIFNKLMIGLVFKPLAYVTVNKKERAIIEKKVTCVKDILDLGVFGPIEKLQLIKRKFPNHLLIFRKYA